MTIVTLSHCHTSRFGGILGKELVLKGVIFGKELEEVRGSYMELEANSFSLKELEGVKGS